MPKLSNYKRNEPTTKEIQTLYDESINAFTIGHNKRVRDQGARLYRMRDGSLSLQRASLNPYTVASRAVWHDLTTYCRSQEITAQHEKQDWSLRYNINVPYSEHLKYIFGAGLEPEQDETGAFIGLPQIMDPMKDIMHPFNDPASQWKVIVDQVFAVKPFSR